MVRVKSDGALTYVNRTMKPEVAKVLRNPNKQRKLSRSNIEEATENGTGSNEVMIDRKKKR